MSTVAKAALVTVAVTLAAGPLVGIWWGKKMIASIDRAVRLGERTGE